MSQLALDAAFGSNPEAQRVAFKRVMARREDRVGDSPEVERLSLASAGYLYPREGVTDRQQASESTEQRSLRVRINDLVINPMWLTGGSVAVSRCEGAVSPDYRVFEPSDEVEPRFLHHLLRSTPYRDQYNLFVRANTTFDRRIQQVDLDAMSLWLPPRDEQRRIADFLDDRVARIDKIITARTLQANLVEEAFLARMRAGVAGALNDDNTTTNSEIPWIERCHASAVTVSMARVLTLQRGVDLTDQQRRPGDVPVITTAGVVGKHDVAICQGPGVVIGRYGSVGNVHWVDGPFWPHNTTLYVKQTQGNDMRWIYYLLRSFPYAAMQARAAVPGINRNDLAVELVPWIPVPLQRRAVELLVADEHASKEHRAELEASVTLLSEYKQSLITAAVSGELDVSTAGSGIPG